MHLHNDNSTKTYFTFFFFFLLLFLLAFALFTVTIALVLKILGYVMRLFHAYIATRKHSAYYAICFSKALQIAALTHLQILMVFSHFYCSSLKDVN